MSEPEWPLPLSQSIADWAAEQFRNAGFPVESMCAFRVSENSFRLEGNYHGWSRLALVEVLDNPPRLHISSIVT